MFTGLVAAQGRVQQAANSAEGMKLKVDLEALGEGLDSGASVALSGVCCTVVERDGSAASFDLSAETLARTWLGSAAPGTLLNLEPALRAGDPMGGHLVQGHVDGVGEVVSPVGAGGGEWWVRLPRDLLRYCVIKGSVALDGVSLTIAAIEGDRVMSAIIPHTAQVTTIGTAPAGQPVHVEVDVLAKYVERLIAPYAGG